MEIDRKEKQGKKSIPYSSSSSSRSSSISSVSSSSDGGHFDIRHFPLPKPSLSASEARKQRDSYNSNRSSYTGSSWSSNHLLDLPNYDPNRIPSSVFSTKPANSADWSLASNESLFSIQDANFSISTMEEDHGLASALKSSDIPKSEEPVHEITEINPVSLPPPIKPYQVEEISYSDIDDNEEHEEEEEEDEEEKEEEAMIEEEVLVEIESVEKALVQDVKEDKPEDSYSNTSNSPTLSCRSDTSNNSISSFAFPVYQKEDGVVKTPSLEMKCNVSHKQYQLPRSPIQPPRPQLQPQSYSESRTLDKLQPQSKPKQLDSQTQSPRASRHSWFSCFQCRSKFGL